MDPIRVANAVSQVRNMVRSGRYSRALAMSIASQGDSRLASEISRAFAKVRKPAIPAVTKFKSTVPTRVLEGKEWQ